MTKPKILVTLSTFAEFGSQPLDLLKTSGLPFALNTSGKRLTPEQVINLGKDCHGIIAGVEPYTSAVLTELPELKCISRCGVGTDNVDLIKAKGLGIAVLNTPDPVVVPVAELTVGMILDLLRKITWHTVRLRDKKWEKQGGQNLQGKTVGLIGLGRIGKKVSELLGSFGVRLIASDPHPDHTWAKEHHVAIIPTHELLKNADIVSLHLKADTKNPFVLGAHEIHMMKKGAVLLNLARGELVDEKALFEALKTGHLAGAGLDVFSQEPYAGPLTSLENVIMTPHIATLTAESRLEMEMQAVQNLLMALGTEK